MDNKLILVASGNLLSVNPDRMIIKRVVLSGHPLKVNKRSAVVRFMFFNREDIKYFQAVKLRTKYGRIGHIKEPLGKKIKCFKFAPKKFFLLTWFFYRYARAYESLI